MKAFRILTLIAISITLFGLGCEDATEEKPDCEKNNYGEVVIKNETGFDDLVVKVNNNERTVLDGENTTYNEVDAGNITIWMSLKRNSASNEENKTLDACEKYTFTVNPPACADGDYGWVNVKNETGEDNLHVDVTSGTTNEYNDERIIDYGETTTYEIEAGTIRIWASYTGDSDDWVYSEEELKTCEEMDFEWNPKKKEKHSLSLELNDEVLELKKSSR